MTDKSNNLFTISPALPTVTVQNGGESWIAGTSRTITWNSATYTSTNVAIEYSIDSGSYLVKCINHNSKMMVHKPGLCPIILPPKLW